MLVFWDIDGTLLTTGRAGLFAWQEALAEVAGAEADLDTFDTAGHPDFGIARRLLTQVAGVAEPETAVVRRLVERYEDRLPAALHRRTGAVLPNVREILTQLAGEPGAVSMLLTGNTRRGAEAKLAHYGLGGIFAAGAFSELDADRPAIARAALAHARAAGTLPDPDRVFVVGDTPHDIRCARAIDARAIGVATGAYDAAALAAEGAWRVFAQLPAAPDFMAVLRAREVPAHS